MPRETLKLLKNWIITNRKLYISFRCYNSDLILFYTLWNDYHKSLITICHWPKLLRFYCLYSVCYMGFPGGISGKELACQCRRHKRRGFNPWVRKIPWSREWQPTPIFLLGKSHGQRSLVGYSPWGLEEWDTTERAHTHTQCCALHSHDLFI